MEYLDYEKEGIAKFKKYCHDLEDPELSFIDSLPDDIILRFIQSQDFNEANALESLKYCHTW